MLKKQKHGLTFARQVPAAESDRLAYEVQEDATLEGVTARIYKGAENTLRLNVLHIPASGSPTSLVENVDADGDGKDYIDGDDDAWTWEPSVPVEEGDSLVVDHENTDGSNAHNYRVNMNLDYMGGTERLLAGIKAVIGGRWG